MHFHQSFELTKERRIQSERKKYNIRYKLLGKMFLLFSQRENHTLEFTEIFQEFLILVNGKGRLFEVDI